MEAKIKILSDNRSAGHNYLLSERMEAGLVLTGTEVKAARDGKIQLKDAFGEVTGNEAWLVNAHIAKYSHGNIMNHEPVRRRKLLLHREEIGKEIDQHGGTIRKPQGRCKVERAFLANDPASSAATPHRGIGARRP